MVSEESNRIWTAFTQFALTGDETLISSFSRQQIEFTITQFTNKSDRNDRAYKAMELRLAILKEHEDSKRDTSAAWKDRLIGIVFGVIITILGNALWKWITGE